MSDRTKKPKPFRYPREVDADELDALEADSRRWRTVERALAAFRYLRVTVGDDEPLVQITLLRGDAILVTEKASGPTLDAAADQLAERMDKEAK